jgi:hypothetical protein
MFPKLDPCTTFEELFAPHLNDCRRCQKAVESIEEVEWNGQFKSFCAAGMEIINSHLRECKACSSSASLYLQQLADALITPEGTPIQ